MSKPDTIFDDFFYGASLCFEGFGDEKQPYQRFEISASRIMEDTRFMSYRTTIGLLLRNKENRICFCYSIKHFSTTTACHINALLAACPYPGDRIFAVPFERDDHSVTTAEGVAALYEKALQKRDPAELHNNEYRKTFRTLWESAFRFSKTVHEIPEHAMQWGSQLAQRAQQIENERRRRCVA